MARRGPKGLSPEALAARGETRPSRKVVPLFGSVADRPDPERIDAPAWLSKEAKTIFAHRVDAYRKRGQKVDGFQEALASYSALSAELQSMRKRQVQPTMAMVAQERMWAAEFYDTPASQKVPAGGKTKEGNTFSRNGQRGQPAG